MQLVSTPYSLQSKGHYSPGVIHGDLVYISGQLPINYTIGETLPVGGVEEQTRQVLENLEYILKQCGSSKQQVLKTTVYIPDINSCFCNIRLCDLGQALWKKPWIKGSTGL